MATLAEKIHEPSFTEMRRAMVDSQLRPNAVTDGLLITAMGVVPREEFVPKAMAGVAYIDRPLSVSRSRRINAPLVTARLIEAADIRPGSRVLLVGAASGYAASVLAAMGARVTALESDRELIDCARTVQSPEEDQVEQAGIEWIEGPLAAGVPHTIAFDRIVIDGAVEQFPGTLVAELVEGGIMTCALREGRICRLAQGIKTSGILVLRPFVDMDAVLLPGFSVKRGFAF